MLSIVETKYDEYFFRIRSSLAVSLIKVRSSDVYYHPKRSQSATSVGYDVWDAPQKILDYFASLVP